MLYHSTRSSAPYVDSAQAVLEGLAPDGGLYMPEYIPCFDWQGCLRWMLRAWLAPFSLRCCRIFPI